MLVLVGRDLMLRGQRVRMWGRRGGVRSRCGCDCRSVRGGGNRSESVSGCGNRGGAQGWLGSRERIEGVGLGVVCLFGGEGEERGWRSGSKGFGIGRVHWRSVCWLSWKGRRVLKGR